jgi:hypothetical protein
VASGTVFLAAGALLPARGVLEAIALVLVAWGLGLAVAGVFILLGRNPLRAPRSGGR